MKLILAFFSFVFALSGSSAGAGPLIVGNAAGLTELQYVYTWKNIADFVKIDVRGRLNAVANSSHKELIFLSGQEHPQVFAQPSFAGALPFATAKFVGAQVYINSDLLYNNPLADVGDLSAPIEVLSAALAYQSGLQPKQALALGQEIGHAWRAQIQNLPWKSPLGNMLQVNILQSDSVQVIAFDSYQAHFLHKDLVSALQKHLGATHVALKKVNFPYWVPNKSQVSLLATVDFVVDGAPVRAEVSITLNLKESAKDDLVLTQFTFEFFEIQGL